MSLLSALILVILSCAWLLCNKTTAALHLLTGRGRTDGRRGKVPLNKQPNKVQMVWIHYHCWVKSRAFFVWSFSFTFAWFWWHEQDRCKAKNIEVRVNGPSDDDKRLPNTLSISIKGLKASQLLQEVSSTLAASAGSACHSGAGMWSLVYAVVMLKNAKVLTLHHLHNINCRPNIQVQHH